VSFIVYMMFKITFKAFWWMLWLCWAMLALTVSLIASLTGHDRAARQWTRSLNWRRVF
jgi:hypothetical protein